MVEGESGILNVCTPEERPKVVSARNRLEWPNGAKTLLFSAESPERLRGKQHAKLWCDELAAWRYPESWDQAVFGLRLGDKPQAVITTTPRPTKLLRELLESPLIFTTKSATYDNLANLPEAFAHKILRAYEGMRLGRQELEAELLLDTPGALWTRAMIEAAYRHAPPKLTRIVVAIDPPASSSERADEWLRRRRERLRAWSRDQRSLRPRDRAQDRLRARLLTGHGSARAQLHALGARRDAGRDCGSAV